MRRRFWLWVFGLILASALGACRAVSDTHVIEEPGTVESVEGTDVARITLAPSAEERLGIETTEVTVMQGRGQVPSSALLIDPTGRFWVYTAPSEHVYIRQQIEDIHQDGLTTLFSDGPQSGTRVVTVGVPELYGFESGIGH